MCRMWSWDLRFVKTLRCINLMLFAFLLLNLYCHLIEETLILYFS